MYYYGKSDTGMKRSINQDRFCCKKIWSGSALLAVVCDGIGGHKAGEVASAMTVDTVCTTVSFASYRSDTPEKNYIAIKKILVDAINEANSDVFMAAQNDEGLSGMGTTIVSALITDNTLFCCAAGDSRLYLVNRDASVQITRDHTFVQRLIDMHKMTPDEAKMTMKSNVITRAVGIEETILVDFFSLPLDKYSGSHILLCTDGLTNHLTDEDIFDIVNSGVSDGNDAVSDKVTRLIDSANNNGGSDNITAVLIAI